MNIDFALLSLFCGILLTSISVSSNSRYTRFVAGMVGALIMCAIAFAGIVTCMEQKGCAHMTHYAEQVFIVNKE